MPIRPSLQRQLIPMQPPTEHETRIQLSSRRDAIVSSEIEKCSTVFESSDIVSDIVRRQTTSEFVEVSCTVFVARVDEPARERSQLAIARIVVNVEIDNVNEPIIDNRIRSPCFVAAKQCPHFASTS